CQSGCIPPERISMNQALLALGGTGSLYGRWHTGGRGRLRQDRRDVCRPPSRRARRRVPWPLPGPSAIRRLMPPGPAQPRDGFLPQDARYERAQAFLRTTRELFDSWRGDEIIADKAAGVFLADGEAGRFDHRDAHFDISGRFNVP